MSLKSGLGKFQRGGSLTPNLTFWGVIGVAGMVIAILIGIELGKYLLGKGKRVVGGVAPGLVGDRMGEVRGSMGI